MHGAALVRSPRRSADVMSPGDTPSPPDVGAGERRVVWCPRVLSRGCRVGRLRCDLDLLSRQVSLDVTADRVECANQPTWRLSPGERDRHATPMAVAPAPRGDRSGDVFDD